MNELNRRTFTRHSLGSLLTFSMIETLCSHDLFAEKVKPITAKWLTRINQLALEVKDQQLLQTKWQEQVESLLGEVDLRDLLQLIDFDRLTKNLQYVDNGARSIRFKFPDNSSLPTKVAFGKQIFALKNNRSVVPHGHNNMTTAFLVLKGTFHGRHYDRIEDLEDHFIIRPTIDRSFNPGEHSSISDVKDNIHWFKCTSNKGFLFNIHVNDVTSDSNPLSRRVYLDPNGEKLSDGLVRAPRIRYKQAHQLYG